MSFRISQHLPRVRFYGYLLIPPDLLPFLQVFKWHWAYIFFFKIGVDFHWLCSPWSELGMLWSDPKSQSGHANQCGSFSETLLFIPFAWLITNLSLIHGRPKKLGEVKDTSELWQEATMFSLFQVTGSLWKGTAAAEKTGHLGPPGAHASWNTFIFLLKIQAAHLFWRFPWVIRSVLNIANSALQVLLSGVILYCVNVLSLPFTTPHTKQTQHVFGSWSVLLWL